MYASPLKAMASPQVKREGYDDAVHGNFHEPRVEHHSPDLWSNFVDFGLLCSSEPFPPYQVQTATDILDPTEGKIDLNGLETPADSKKICADQGVMQVGDYRKHASNDGGIDPNLRSPLGISWGTTER